MPSENIDILMSTYNGEKYLEEQIVSILNQTYRFWNLYIRDDGSSDGTVEIIRYYSSKYKNIQLIIDSFGNLGPAGSFLRLMDNVESDFFMFCDQDDIWLPRKIELSLGAYVDKKIPNHIPGLVFTDLEVVSSDLSLISPSFLRYQRYNYKYSTCFNRLLMQNVITGCTMFMNKAVLDCFKSKDCEVYDEMIMHDWWIGLFVCAFGESVFLNVPTIKYRQHSNNEIGSKGSGLRRLRSILFKESPVEKTINYIEMVARQASCFLQFYGDDLSEYQVSSIGILSNLSIKKNIFSVIACFSRGLKMNTFERNLGVFVSFLFASVRRSV